MEGKKVSASLGNRSSLTPAFEVEHFLAAFHPVPVGLQAFASTPSALHLFALQALELLLPFDVEQLCAQLIAHLGCAVPRVCAFALSALVDLDKVVAFVSAALYAKLAQVLGFGELTQVRTRNADIVLEVLVIANEGLAVPLRSVIRLGHFLIHPDRFIAQTRFLTF